MNAPRLNINGTSYDALYVQLSDAILANIVATERLHDAGPHPRDFVNDLPGYRRAAKDHTRRLDLMREIRRELEEIREDICSQHDSRMR